MERNLKIGGFTGAVFAGLAYLLTYRMGFNPETLTYLLYLYIVLGFILASDPKELLSGRDLFDRLVLIGKDEEKRLKKVFTGEEYRVDGTVEKISDP